MAFCTQHSAILDGEVFFEKTQHTKTADAENTLYYTTHSPDITAYLTLHPPFFKKRKKTEITDFNKQTVRIHACKAQRPSFNWSNVFNLETEYES